MNIIIIGATSNICKIRVFKNLELLKHKINHLYCVSRISPQQWHDIPHSPFINSATYIKCDNYETLRKFIDEKTYIYVCIPPSRYSSIISFFNSTNGKKLILEKPLALNYEQYKSLTFTPKIYLMDHFILKRDIIHLVNQPHGIINKIHFDFLYEHDVEDRLTYFDQTGFFIDMFQSHLLSILYLLLKHQLSNLLDYDVNIIRKQYRPYSGKNSEADTYFYLTLSGPIEITMEIGKSMKPKKQIFVNDKQYIINNYEDEYYIFFNQMDKYINLLPMQELFWKITHHVQKYFKPMEYYPKLILANESHV